MSALLVLMLAPSWALSPPAEAPVVRAAPQLEGVALRIPLNPAVKGFVAFFEKGRGRRIYARWYWRMGRFKALMEPILEEHGLPKELIYVCMIESGFHPDATSPAAAVGPWQFVRSTGRSYDLRHDDWVDERRDPIKATKAAARHLRDLHRRFGTWALSLAAYNAGVGSVARAIERANSNDFWALVQADVLPDDATRYVPKAMAAMLIGQDPGAHGFGDVVPAEPWSFVLVEVPGGMALSRAARAAKVPLTELEGLNPELRRGYTPPDGEGYMLRVPKAAAAKLKAAMGGIRGRRPGLFVERRVRFGERLRDLAREHGIARGELRRLNELPRGEPKPGQVLLVPKGKAKPVLNELLIGVEPEVDYAVDGHREILVPLRRRMALAEAAEFFGLAPGRLALWNGLDPEAALQRGMVLRVFVPKDFDLKSTLRVNPERVTWVPRDHHAVMAARARAEAERPPAVKRVEHVVSAGQTLWTIAKRYSVTVGRIRAENGMGRRSGLHVGQKLMVPVWRAPKPRGKARRAKPKAGARGRKKHKVRPGDTLGKIADRYGIDLSDLRKRNGMRRSSRIYPGQVLVIP